MQTTATRIILVGATGRMGALIDALATPRPDVDIVARLDAHASYEGGRGAADVVVDFSAPAGTMRAVEAARRTGAALLCGTTGLGRAQTDALTELSQHQAVLTSSNTSIGVAILRRLVAQAAEWLPSDYSVEILDVHHAMKRDQPSGTALALVEACVGAGRSTGAESVRSIREGDTVGDHEVAFAGPLETLSIRHSAGSRKLFADGAIRAAIWLRGRSSGLWSMDDVFDSGGGSTAVTPSN
ncbi:MAG: 4-hydroxy-tetrahydrodipicolinate reductase [Phycisphaerales bacterium]